VSDILSAFVTLSKTCEKHRKYLIDKEPDHVILMTTIEVADVSELLSTALGVSCGTGSVGSFFFRFFLFFFLVSLLRLRSLDINLAKRPRFAFFL